MLDVLRAAPPPADPVYLDVRQGEQIIYQVAPYEARYAGYQNLLHHIPSRWPS